MEKVSIVQMKEVLLVSLQADLHDQAALAFQSDLLNQIESTSAKGVLIDLSRVDLVDSFLGRILSETAAMARTMNAAVVVVGIQPFVAITLVELGLELKQIPTALNVERGLQLLQEKMKQQKGTTSGPAQLIRRRSSPPFLLQRRGCLKKDSRPSGGIPMSFPFTPRSVPSSSVRGRRCNPIS